MNNANNAGTAKNKYAINLVIIFNMHPFLPNECSCRLLKGIEIFRCVLMHFLFNYTYCNMKLGIVFVII